MAQDSSSYQDCLLVMCRTAKLEGRICPVLWHLLYQAPYSHVLNILGLGGFIQNLGH